MSDACARLAEARARYERGDLPGALAACQELVTLEPLNAEALNDLGTVLFAMGRAEQGRDCFARALQLDPANVRARSNMEMARRAQGAANRSGPLFCPCCGGSYAEFLPAGVARKTPNRKCPGCGSLERHRGLWLFMLNRTNLLTDELRLLHFAPKPAIRKLLAAMPNVDYVTADLDPRRGAIKMDITDILFRDDVFDVVLAVHVLEHVSDDRRAMSEVCRVLKPGGWAILQSPILRAETLEDPSVQTPADRERVYGQSDHCRAYGRDYRDRLEDAGFDVSVDDYLRRLGPETAARHRLGGQLDIYFCRKPAA